MLSFVYSRTGDRGAHILIGGYRSECICLFWYRGFCVVAGAVSDDSVRIMWLGFRICCYSYPGLCDALWYYSGRHIADRCTGLLSEFQLWYWPGNGYGTLGDIDVSVGGRPRTTDRFYYTSILDCVIFLLPLFALIKAVLTLSLVPSWHGNWKCLEMDVSDNTSSKGEF